MFNIKNFKIFKSDDDRREVFGWASVAVRINGEIITDHQNDVLDIQDLESAAYDFTANSRSAGDMHQKHSVGTLIESVVFTKEKFNAMGIPDGILPEGWWVGFHIFDDETWSKIKNGTYSMFSIEGTAVRQFTEDKPTTSL